MNLVHLVKMANAIGTFYDSYPDRPAGIAGIAAHLRRSWEPRMRRELIAHVEAGGTGLLPIVLDAVRTLEPPTAARASRDPA